MRVPLVIENFDEAFCFKLAPAKAVGRNRVLFQQRRSRKFRTTGRRQARLQVRLGVSEFMAIANCR